MFTLKQSKYSRASCLTLQQQLQELQMWNQETVFNSGEILPPSGQYKERQ